MATKTSKAAELLALIEEQSADDLAEIDAAIIDAEKKLDGLRQARKLVAAKLGIAPEPKAQGGSAKKITRSAPSGGPNVLERVLGYIAKNGPERVSELATKLSVSYGAIHSAVSNNGWFDKQTDGVHLTTAGVQAAKDRGNAS